MERKKATAPYDGRADVLVSEAFDCSRSQASRAIAQGRVWAEGTPISKASQPIAAGVALAMDIPEPAELALEKQNIPIDILYQDAALALVVKPAGMVVHPAPGNEKDTLVNGLLFALEGLSGIGGVKRPGIVHRLDKDTSGLLLVAKNDEAHRALSAQLKARTMDKHYLAVVEGEMKEEKGAIDAPLGRSKRDRKKIAIDPEGRQALTEWHLLENLRGGALLDVRIITGRTHQIRVHMRSIHHPLVGDALYGPKNGLKAPGLMLHAHTLSFDHPTTGERLTFTAPPPEAFTSALKGWRLYPEAPWPY